MSEYVVLNNVEHLNLKVLDKVLVEDSSAPACTSLVLSELREALRHFPIVFHQKPDSGELFPVAIFGFEQGENLFIRDGQWPGGIYQPLMLRKGPFQIGHQRQSDGTESRVISVDLSDTRINDKVGEALFLAHGGNAPYTQSMAEVLYRLHEERALTGQFCEALQQHDLLQPFVLEAQLAEQNNIRLSGFLSIDEEKLAGLNAGQLQQLNQLGFLQLAYFCMASLTAFSDLLSRKRLQQVTR
ncbi:SapC family protein [Planctobacterium marinum]|uniref:SapC family protein n=1 Tax=Planctobacterium marinum TaxID=1631968 RepID=UPI001E591715|nr:SapC family protein [Planctobacterium marinum]MCC2605692.1 SapC family protein [Planctobacterium marinum]